MSERRPLVLIAGEVKELPSGDTLPGAGGGGSGSVPSFSFTQDVAGSTSVGSGEFYKETGPDTFYIDKRNADGEDFSGLLDEVGANWLVEAYDPNDPEGTYAILKVSSSTLSGDKYILGGSIIESAGDILLATSLLIALDAVGSSGGGSTAFNDLGNATGSGSVDNGGYSQTWNWSSTSGAAFVIQINSSDVFTISESATNTYIGFTATGFAVAASSVNLAAGTNVYTYICDATGFLSFFGVTAASRQTDPGPSDVNTIMDGLIASLTVSDPPAQSDVQSLRDQCESLRDWLSDLAGRYNAVQQLLLTYGLTYTV